MENEKHDVDFLWDILKRYDHYIGTINFKSALLATANAALFAGLLLPYLKEGGLSDEHNCLSIIAILMAIGITASYLLIIKTIWPSLGNSTTDSHARSLIFFGSVSKMSLEDFREQYNSSDPTSLKSDLIQQVHEVAKATNQKFRSISHAGLTTGASFIVAFLFILAKMAG